MTIKARVIDGLDKVSDVLAGLPGASAFVTETSDDNDRAEVMPQTKQDEAFVVGRFREMGLM